MPDPRPPEPPNPRPRKQGFVRYNIPAGELRTLPECAYIRVYSFVGSLTLSFNDGDAVPVMAGDKFGTYPGTVFEKVNVESSGGAVLIIGFGWSDSPGARTRYDENTGGFYVATSTGETQLIA